ncbi:protein kinase domain-containing protein [Cryptosporangium aurantiacum]|uniref:protein kinase domain-containing protein n=1 Tax=Cryptosporangium aurantiacum TaxID=134849 RepID=UPI000932B906|nr:protein kinase [Cryptosporangium aurantiacum]
MRPSVHLTIVAGPLSGRTYRYEERTTCILGRADDCEPQLPSDTEHRTVSRHHCLIDINPPDVRIRDFGSLNGTYLNRVKIGQRAKGQTPEEAAGERFPEHDLSDGDEIRLGRTTFRVGIQRRVATLVMPRCAHCGRDIADEVGGHDGEHVCQSCRAQPAALVRDALPDAGPGFVGYEVVRELGAGGMGRVYLARNTTTGEEVALKVMLPQVAASEADRGRFLREIAIGQALRHPNIASLHHTGSAAGAFFFAIEYCRGGSVRDLMLARGGTLRPDEAVPLAVQALDALDYAHSQGIVHRDVSPQNILLTDDPKPQVKLADFGLAKAFDLAGLSGLTRTGAAAGKPLFMPYQQVVNFRHAKPAVDVWALAACLYFLLTDEAPRDFPADRDPWQAVLQTAAVPIRQRDPAIPRPLADVLDTALQDRPAIGFATAAELREALLRSTR